MLSKPPRIHYPQSSKDLYCMCHVGQKGWKKQEPWKPFSFLSMWSHSTFSAVWTTSQMASCWKHLPAPLQVLKHVCAMILTVDLAHLWTLKETQSKTTGQTASTCPLVQATGLSHEPRFGKLLSHDRAESAGPDFRPSSFETFQSLTNSPSPSYVLNRIVLICWIGSDVYEERSSHINPHFLLHKASYMWSAPQIPLWDINSSQSLFGSQDIFFNLKSHRIQHFLLSLPLLKTFCRPLAPLLSASFSQHSLSTLLASACDQSPPR